MGESLADRSVVCVTGSGGLIGSVLSRGLLLRGWRVVAVDFSEEALASSLRALQAEFGSDYVTGFVADVTNENQLAKVIQDAHIALGRIRGLVNCVYPKTPSYGMSPREISYEDFSENLSLLVGTQFIPIKVFLKYFEENGGGTIVNTGSIYGTKAPRFELYAEGTTGVPLEYAVAKAGIIQMTKYFAKEYRSKRIRLNCLSPGGISSDRVDEVFLEAYGKHCSNYGMMDASNLIDAAEFLLTERSKFINGQNLVVDDGFTL